MSYNYRGLIPAVLTDLDDPDVHHPSAEMILQACGDVGQMLHNQLQNTSIGWGVSSWTLPAGSGTGRYIVSAPNFGKALRLVARSIAGQWQGGYQIDIIDRQNLLAFQRGTYIWPTQDGFGPYTTSQVAILEYDQGVPYIELVPDVTPGDCELKLWYETGEIERPQLDGNFLPQVKNFHPYARLQISLRCVPYAYWSREVADIQSPERRKAEIRAKRKELADSLTMAIMQQQADWEEYIATNRQTGSARPRYYGDEYEAPMYGDNYLGRGNW